MYAGGLIGGPIAGALLGRLLTRIGTKALIKKLRRRAPAIIRKRVESEIHKMIRKIYPWTMGFGALAGLSGVLSIYGLHSLLKSKNKKEKRRR